MRKRLPAKVTAFLLAAAMVFTMIPGIHVYAQESLAIAVDEKQASDTQTVRIPANSTVAIEASSAAYFILTIEDHDITLNFKNQDYRPVNGKIEVFLTKNQQVVPFNLTNHSGAEKTVVLKFSRYQGHKTNPFILGGTQPVEFFQDSMYANVGNENGTFYQWTAPQAGKVDIRLEVLESSAGNLLPFVLIDDVQSENGVMTVNVTQGQTLLLRLIAHAEGNMMAPNAKLRIQVSYQGVSVQPSVPDHNCYVDHFTDVDVSKWYHDALDYMVSQGYMNGVSETSMDPNGELTRAQWAKLLYEVAGRPNVSTMRHPFTDVAAGKWYTDAVVWAFNYGIVKGVSATEFGPNSKITREQMATMLYRYAGSPGVTGGLYRFLDGSAVSGFAKNAMTWATQKGIINGVGGNYLEPKGNATRAQAAKILYEYLN